MYRNGTDAIITLKDNCERSTRQLLSRDNLKEFGIIVSNSTLLRWEAAGRFPRRVRMGGTTVAWIKSEVDDWFSARSAERSHTHYADF